MGKASSSKAPRRRACGAGWRVLAVAGFLAVIGVYVWTLHSARGDLKAGANKRDYYNLLVDGFQDGHLHMKAEVDPALAAMPPKQRPGNAPYLLDASLYDGRYYLYFGVVPAVLLHWPFAAITGLDMPDAMAVLVLAGATLVFGFLWWWDLRRHLWPALGPRLDWLVLLALGLGTGIPAVLRRPLFYEEATLSGWLFGAMMLWALLRAYAGRGRGTGWLILAGVACGLAVGSRANLVLAGVGTLAVGAILAGRRFSPGWKRGVLPSLMAAGAGALVIGAGLAAYNYARFGSVLEFGHSHQIGQNPDQMFRVTNLLHNLGLYYGRPPGLNVYFPYVFPPDEGTKPFDYIGRESVHGEWLWLLAAVLVAPAFFSGGKACLVLLVPMACWFAGNLLVTGLLGVRANRYMLDFHPALVALVLAGAGWIATRKRGRCLWLTAVMGIGLLAAVFNVLAGFQVHGFFLRTDPAGYERLGRAFDRVVWRVVPGLVDRAGDWETQVRWPPQGEGGVVPLLTAGVPEFQDQLWVRLDGHGRAAFEFQHRDFGSARGPEFDYQPGADVRLRLGGAFLLPPVWHDWYGALSPEQRSAVRRRLRIRADEVLVFDRDVPSFATSPHHVAWNSSLQHGGVRVLPPETQWAGVLAGRAGAVRLRLRLPQDRFGSNEPLMQTGTLEAWDMVMIQFTRPGHVRLIHDSSDRGGASSEEFPVDYDAWHTVEIESPATHDGLTWNKHDTLELPAGDRIVVRWNGRVVFDSPVPASRASPASASVGTNDFASSCRASYAAEMEVAPFLAPIPAGPARAWEAALDPQRVFVGERGVLLHWLREDGRHAAVVWQRMPGEERCQLGWLDNGLVQWAGPLDAGPAEPLRFELPSLASVTHDPDADLVPFRLSRGGRELIAGNTDFFATPMILARALSGADWNVTATDVAASDRGAAGGLPGRIRMHLALPADGLRESAPLLTMGKTGRADALFLRPTGPDTYVLGLDHWGVGAYQSEPLRIPAGRRFELVAEVGSLFDEAGFPPDLIRVWLDGERVLEVRTSLHPVQVGEVWIGRNPLGFSTCSERFPGAIFSVRRHAPALPAAGLGGP